MMNRRYDRNTGGKEEKGEGEEKTTSTAVTPDALNKCD